MPFENNKINENNYHHIVMSITTIKFMELGIINPKPYAMFYLII